MDRFPHSAEARNERVTTEARARHSTITRAIIDGDEAMTKRISDAMGEHLGDGHVLPDLVRQSLLTPHAFLRVLTDVIWDEAAQDAEKEVEAKERRYAESVDDNRIAMAEADRELA